MRKNFSSIGAAIILIVLFLVGQIFIASKDIASFYLSKGIKSSLALAGALFSGNQDLDAAHNLILENQQLQAQILTLSKNPYGTVIDKQGYVVAKIYSTYPFNDRGLLTINAGNKAGVKKLASVTIGGYLFLGQVTEVFETYSLVRTIFDSGWQLPVKVGTDANDALLIGGREPRLSLIVKDKNLESDQSVYTAGKDFPYGLKIGIIKEITNDVGSAFKEAGISLPYAISDVTEVYVLSR